MLKTKSVMIIHNSLIILTKDNLEDTINDMNKAINQKKNHQFAIPAA